MIFAVRVLQKVTEKRKTFSTPSFICSLRFVVSHQFFNTYTRYIMIARSRSHSAFPRSVHGHLQYSRVRPLRRNHLYMFYNIYINFIIFNMNKARIKYELVYNRARSAAGHWLYAAYAPIRACRPALVYSLLESKTVLLTNGRPATR